MTEPSNPKKASIPQWQRIAAAEAPEQSPSEPEDSTKAEPPPSRPALIEQATKFLEDGEVRDAPAERKVAFLESKGLTSDEIQQVVGEAQVSDGSASAQVNNEVLLALMSSKRLYILTKELTTKSSSPNPSSSSSSAISTSSPPSAPPIITYPEFLTPHTPPSPPLITTSLLFSTLYLFSGLSLTLYGANKYLVAPMLSSLTTARHELASTTTSNISTLNTKLSTLVSEIPFSAQSSHHRKSSDGKEEGEDSDAESDTSDPNELFHRDYGTQTSPSLSSRPGTSMASNCSSNQPAPTPLDAQEKRLSILRIHLSELLEDHTSQLSASDEVSTRVQDLTTYLNGLHYSSSYYSSAGIYGGPISGAGLGGVGATPAGVEDMVAKVKAEIRGVKGVLLSARNFPGGGGRLVGKAAD